MPAASSQHMTSTTFSTRSGVQVPAVTTDQSRVSWRKLAGGSYSEPDRM